MTGASGDSTMVLDDEVARDPTQIGPIEVRVRARWPRVDRALEGLQHGNVTYRWRLDSTEAPALFVEVPVTEDANEQELLRYRDRVRSVIREVSDTRSVYVHFVGSEDPEAHADDA